MFFREISYFSSSFPKFLFFGRFLLSVEMLRANYENKMKKVRGINLFLIVFNLHSVFDEVHGLDDGCGATPAQPAEQKLPPVRHLNLLRHFPSFFLSKFFLATNGNSSPFFFWSSLFCGGWDAVGKFKLCVNSCTRPSDENWILRFIFSVVLKPLLVC